jgi:hypothetical protein
MAMFAAGLAIEAMADAQKSAFKADLRNAGEIAREMSSHAHAHTATNCKSGRTRTAILSQPRNADEILHDTVRIWIARGWDEIPVP